MNRSRLNKTRPLRKAYNTISAFICLINRKVNRHSKFAIFDIKEHYKIYLQDMCRRFCVQYVFC